jgi:hypothetical protein
MTRKNISEYIKYHILLTIILGKPIEIFLLNLLS